jgi:type IV pilus assembly protein PilN
MIRINLLPREDAPKNRSLVLPSVTAFAPLVLVIVAAGVMTVMSIYQDQKIRTLEQVIADEEAESRRLAPEIAKIKRLDQQRQDLNQRLDVITNLDRDRYFRVHLLDDLNRALPENLWLVRFENTGGDAYAIEGVTFSNFLVSDFLQNLADSPYYEGVNLEVAERGDIKEVEVVRFKLQAQGVRAPSGAAIGG